MNTEDTNHLLSEFAPHSYEDWRAAAEALLKGKPFEKLLITSTYEGFDLQPIYRKEDVEELLFRLDVPGAGSRVRGQEASAGLETGWKVSQELAASDPKSANALILEVLERGQNEVNLWFDLPTRTGLDADHADAGRVGVCGLSLSSQKDVDTLLDGIHPEMVSWFLRSGSATPALAALIFDGFRRKGVDLKKTEGCFDFDPLCWLTETGRLEDGFAGAMDRVASFLKDLAEIAPEWQGLVVNTLGYHNAGSSSSQELAYALSTGVAYLKALQERGLDPTQVSSQMRFSLAVGGNYFIEIAKFRAFRILWNQVLTSFGVPEDKRSLHLHARTGLFNKTLFDPYVNMLRTTVEAFAAVVGGVDSLHVGPFDEVVREPDSFSHRIARNTHFILSEECGLNQVIDPAGGSWAVESLTSQMAENAWKAFQNIEEDGGMVDSLANGSIQEEVKKVRAAKAKKLQQRRDVLVGTNQYPNATEELLEARGIDYSTVAKSRKAELCEARNSQLPSTMDALVKAMDSAGEGATLGQLSSVLYPVSGQALEAPKVSMRRAAEEHEALRLASRALAESGNAPKLLQVNMGPSRKYRLRADWTAAFFQVSGLEVEGSQDFDEVADAIAALEESGAHIAVLTSDDGTYAESAVAWAKALKQARPDLYLLLAGAPGESEASYREAGVNDFVHVRVNNYEMNRDILGRLEAELG